MIAFAISWFDFKNNQKILYLVVVLVVHISTTLKMVLQYTINCVDNTSQHGKMEHTHIINVHIQW